MQGYHPQYSMLGVPSMLGFVCKPDMPPHINILFRARPPMEWIPMPKKTTKKHYSGIFDPNSNKNVMDLFEKTAPPKKDAELSKYQVKLKKIVENVEKNRAENKEKIKQWNPKEDPNVHGDPYKTLFVYRLNYKTDEKRLQRKFEFYGPIKRVRIVKDLSGKSRGYAFIEFEHKSDFSNAYKRGDRERIDDKIVYTDFERGRTEKSFKQRRFGGHFPQETRPLPAWLLKDLKNFKENHAEIVEEIKSKYAPVKENKEIKNYENKEIKENDGIVNHANGNNSRSRSRERENKDKEREKDKDKERVRKHRSKSRSRSRSRSRDKKRSKRNNLSPTPKKELNNQGNYNEADNLDENINSVITSKDNVMGIGEHNMNMVNGLEGGELKEASGNGNINKELDEDSDYTDRRRSKKDKKEKKDKKHKKEKKSKKDKKEKKEKKEKRERKDSVEVGEIV